MSRFSNLEFDEEEHKRKKTSSTVSRHYLDQDKNDLFYLNQAQQHFRSGKFEKALRSYSRTLELNPHVFDAWFGQVRMLIELQELKEAKLWADKALEKYHDNPQLIAAKAIVHARMGNKQKAVEFSDAALKSKDGKEYIWLARGEVLLANQNQNYDYCFAKAIIVCQNRDWFLYLCIGRIYKYYNKFAKALKELHKALDLEVGSPFLWCTIGYCQLGIGMKHSAISSFQRALEVETYCPEAKAGIALARKISFMAKIKSWFHRFQ